MRAICIATAAAVACTLSAASLARADLAAANKYLEEASALIAQGASKYDDAGTKLDLAAASLDDGVSDADKKAVNDRISAMRSKINAGADADAKATLTRKLDRAMSEAEQAIGNQVTWKGAADEVKTILDDPEASRLLGADAVKAARAQFGTFQKVNDKKALAANLEQAKQVVAEAESKWAEQKAVLADANASPNSKESALSDTKDELKSAERAFAELPPDNADVKALRGRLDKISAELGASASESQVAVALEKIKRGTDLYNDEFDGWEKETAKPTWAQFTKEQSEAMSRLGRPKTVAYVSRIGDLLKSVDEDEDLAAVKGNPKVKQQLDALKASYAKARAALLANATALTDGAIAAGVNADNESNVSSLHDNIRFVLGEESSDAKPLMDKLQTALDNHEKAGVAGDAAKAKAYQDMTAAATAAWPDMLAKYDVIEDFDPNNAAAAKGKLVKIETDNLMGYRFRPDGAFPFATTVNGIPVAAKYDPAVRAEVSRVEKALGRALGDNDDDGKWTIIARVEGNSGKLQQLIKHEGDLKVDGEKVGTVEGTEARPIDAPIITIVAAHCGPLAVSSK